MHEVGIMEGALDMARRLLEENGGSRLVRVHMTIGSLSGVVPDALQSAFLALSPPFSSFLLLSPFRSHPEKIRKFTRTFFTSGRSNILAYYYYAANSNPAVEPIP